MKGTDEHKNRMAEKQEEVKAAKAELDAKLMTIGNLVHDSVPISNDEVCCSVDLDLLFIFKLSRID